MAKNQIDSRARNKVQMITSNARTVIRIAGRVGVVGAPGSRAGSGRRRGRFLRVGWALAFQYFFLLGLSAFARILFFEFHSCVCSVDLSFQFVSGAPYVDLWFRYRSVLVA